MNLTVLSVHLVHYHIMGTWEVMVQLIFMYNINDIDYIIIEILQAFPFFADVHKVSFATHWVERRDQTRGTLLDMFPCLVPYHGTSPDP